MKTKGIGRLCGRILLLISAYYMVFAPVIPLVSAEDSPKSVPDAVEGAVSRGVDFLLKSQKNDGSIHTGQNQTAMTALALIALAAVGNQTYDPTPEGGAMNRALDFVLLPEKMSNEGYFGNDGSRMYGHGIVTLMLAEMLGMGVDRKQDAVVRDRLKAAVELILRAQLMPRDANSKGGWRYERNSTDSDLSVTIWQLLALRAAKNAGLDVPSEAIDSAVGYVRRCYISPRDASGKPTQKKAPIGYQVGNIHGNGFVGTSYGLLALQLCGDYDAPEVVGAADFLRDLNVNPVGQEMFYYGVYYFSQGMYQRGGEYAEYADAKTTEWLLPRQDKTTGAWRGVSSEDSAGQVYATSMAILSLAVRWHFMPIYQR